MKAQAAFVRPDGAVHLHAKAAVDLDLPIVIDPGDAELNHPLRLNNAFEDFAVTIFLVALDCRFDGLEDFGDRLEELTFIRIALFDDLEDFLN